MKNFTNNMLILISLAGVITISVLLINFFTRTPCLNNCNGQGKCNPDGSCTCTPGLTGSCSDREKCNLDGTCSCLSDFTGPDCSIKTCFKNSGCNTPNGICNQSDGTCSCSSDFTGADCSVKTCFKNSGCNTPNGTCNLDGICVCTPDFTGPDCSVKTCFKNSGCNTPNGTCNLDGICVCTPDFTGPDCSVKTCFKNSGCIPNGMCQLDGTCVCKSGWTGLDCSVSCDNKCKSPCICTENKECDPITLKCMTNPWLCTKGILWVGSSYLIYRIDDCKDVYFGIASNNTQKLLGTLKINDDNSGVITGGNIKMSTDNVNSVDGIINWTYFDGRNTSKMIWKIHSAIK